MKKYTVLFSIALAGVIFSFGMSIYAAVHETRVKSVPTPITIALPANSN